MLAWLTWRYLCPWPRFLHSHLLCENCQGSGFHKQGRMMGMQRLRKVSMVRC